MPSSTLGKISVGLNAAFLAAMAITVPLGISNTLNFDHTWWDVTVGISFPTSIIAFIIGIIAVAKKKDHSPSVYCSILVGILLILFVLLHSLFIND